MAGTFTKSTSGSIVLNNVPGFINGTSSTLTAGGVGNKYNIPMNNASFLKLCSVCFGYTSTASVGNRSIIIQVQDASGAVYFKTTAAAVQAASLTNTYTAGAGLPLSGFLFPIPEMAYLPPGATIVIADTASIDPADTVTFADVIYLT